MRLAERAGPTTCDAHARRLNDQLAVAYAGRVRVVPDDKRQGFSLCIDRLTRSEVDRVVAAIQAVLGAEARGR